MEVLADSQAEILAACLKCVTVALALMFVLWGLRVFMVYVILVGVVVGGLLGFAAGILLSQHTGLTPNAAFFTGLFGMLVGGFIAWPLQKVFVFVITGALAALLGVLIAMSYGTPQEALWLVGGVLFIVVGVISIFMFDYFVIVAMALSAAHVFFNLACNPRYDVMESEVGKMWTAVESVDTSGTGLPGLGKNDLSEFDWSTFDLEDLDLEKVDFSEIDYAALLNNVLGEYEKNLPGYLVIAGTTILFALYFQKAIKRRSKESYAWFETKRCMRRVGYVFALVALCGYACSAFLVLPRLSSGLLSYEAMPWDVVFGVDFVSWMALAFVTSLVMLMFGQKLAGNGTGAGWKLFRFFTLVVVSVGLVPMGTWLMRAVITGDFALTAVPAYYTFFLTSNTPAWVIAVKCAFAGLVLPGLLYAASSRPAYVQPDAPPPPRTP